jgi:hypothetical protein
MADRRSLSVDDLVAMMASSVGEEKAREAVMTVVRTLGTAQGELVLEVLAREPGVIGVTARFVRARAEGPRAGEPSARAMQGSQQPRTNTIDADQIAGLLAPSLGEERSLEIVREALRQHGAPLVGIDRARALDVLEGLACERGIVGVTARFAKARLILLFRR